MAVFDSDVDRPLYGRGPSPGLRFTIYAILSAALMYFDQRGHWVESIRYALQGAAYPLQVAVDSPVAGWRWLTQTLETRAQLRTEVARLQARVRALHLAVMRQAALEQENAQLRGLRSSLPPLIKGWQLAEVIGAETDSLRQRLVIDKGARDGVQAHQVVVDEHGILGQVVRVGPWSAEVLLLTDPLHALPVSIVRTGQRSIAVGTGDSDALSLPYLAANADVRKGDLLVSSGLGGVFPAGLPVARVSEVRRASDRPLASVQARPLATVDRDREVILLQFDASNPAAPRPVPQFAPASSGAPAAGAAHAAGARPAHAAVARSDRDARAAAPRAAARAPAP